MGMYTYGIEIEQFERVNSLDEIKDSVVVIGVNSNIDGRAMTLSIAKLIGRRNRVVFIYEESVRGSISQIAKRMISLGSYDIYCVADLRVVNWAYINDILDRTVSFEEVQNYVGSYETSYAESEDILLELAGAVSNGDVEQITGIVNKYGPSITKMAEVFDDMKAICESTDSKSNESEISKLKGAIEEYKKSIEEIKSKHEEELNDVRNKMIAQASTSSAGGRGIIASPMTITTSTIRCHAKVIIYFKEISYVRYVNAFIKCLAACIEKKTRKNVKLLVYDTPDRSIRYKDFKVVNGSSYDAVKSSIVGDCSVKAVLTEPIQNVLVDTLTSENTDIAIIYDRLYKDTDIVSGASVTKIFVINGMNDYETCKERFKIGGTIITCENSSMLGVLPKQDVIDIKEVPGLVSSSSESTMITKYNALKTSSGEPLIKLIMDKTKASMLSE